MIWRLLLRSWSRLRDLGLVALLAHSLLAAAGPWVALIAALAITAATGLLMATAASTHAKTVSTENRVNALVPVVATTQATVATVQSQKGSGSSLSFPNLSQTETGAVQYNGNDPAVTGTADVGVTSSNGSPAHTHNFGGHHHPEGHFHFTQIAPDYNNLMATLNQMKAALQSAGIL